MAKPLRIFISSPGDVAPERRRAQLVIDKLAKAYARFFTIEPILWEVEPMLASGHFQDQITPPSDTDIVVLIVWSRLGTPLPEKTETRAYHGIDGRVPVTGTEWEFEDALAAQKKSGAPDMLAYRKSTVPQVPLTDKVVKAAAEEQWDKLEKFWNRWFVNQGQFRAAFSTFVDLDGFEARLENDLRKLIEPRIQALRDTHQGVTAPIWLEGSPFRGLEIYRFEHAPIFFGRSAMTKAAVEQLTINAEHGRAFLLILGASGSGKSSLAQAGVLPALTGRGIVPGVGLWRRAVMRPTGHAEGPFLALAEALTAKAALPELLAPKQEIAELAHHLKTSADDPSFPIKAALNQIEEAARTRGDVLKIETARLALIVDQLEELYTASDITADDRRAFVRCLDGLAKSGRVLVLATMRSDYWHRAAETPLLVDMAAGNGRLDLLPPVQDEIMEMIRQPAQAAGIEFETDPVRNIKLDATLATEAANEPGALPLLSFLLDELYKKDVRAGGRSTLTYASMRELGGLKGAIANRANTAFDALPVGVQAALPKVLWELVTVSSSDAEPTAQAAPMARFPEGSPERKFVDTLLNPQVRLLVAEGDGGGGGARVRLAHEALITHWERAMRQIAQHRDDYRTRTTVREALAEWRKAGIGKQRDYLLRDPQLANALDLANRYSDAFNAEQLGFIQASQRRARLMHRLVSAVAVVFTIIAIVASVLGAVAYFAAQQAKAERNRALLFQSRFLTDAANQRIREGDAASGMLLALEALPDVQAGVMRPISLEAESALRAGQQQLREVMVLHGHEDSVLSAAFSPDGKRLVTASNDRTARLWNAATGEVILVLRGHELGVLSAAFSPDGRRVVTASQDMTARLWNAETGKPIGEPLRGHEGPVFTATFSPDGKRIVTASRDKTARLWNAETGKPSGEPLRGHLDAVSSAAFSPDGTRIVTASWDKTLRFWDAETGEKIRVIRAHDYSVRRAEFSPDGKRVVTAANDGTPRVWDATSGEKIQELRGHGREVVSVAFSAGGQLVVTASQDQTARIWDVTTGKQIVLLRGHGDGMNSAAFSPDGQRIVTTSGDKTLRLWDIASGKRNIELRGHTDSVWSVAFSPDGKLLATASYDKTARLWNAGSGEQTGVQLQHDDPVWSAAFSPNGKLLVTASDDKTARIWEVESGKLVCVLRGHDGALNSAAFRPDGKWVVTAAWDRTARFWDVANCEEIVSKRLQHSDDVNTAAFSADGELIVTASEDKIVRLWDAASAKLIREFRGHGGSVASAVFSPDGKMVLSASWDQTARLWDATNGNLIRVLRGHDDAVRSAVFSPDGKQVLTASSDRSTRLWDVATGKGILVIRGHENEVYSAAFSPDGKSVVTASYDSTARVWPIDLTRTTSELIDEAKKTIPRCLSRVQREQAVDNPTPPAWCIEMEKWPYHTQAWKDWLKYQRANLNPPLPDTPEWQPWMTARQSGTTSPLPSAK